MAVVGSGLLRASAPPSGSSSRASRTSSCSSAPTASAAPGATTPTRAAPATSRATSTRFSFAPNPDWSHVFSRQPEIRAYLERVDRRVRRAPAPALRHRPASPAPGTTTALLWRLETSRGDAHRRRRRQRLRRPGRAGAARTSPASATFAGPAFHSARWDHDVDLHRQAGRRRRHRRLGHPVRARARSSDVAHADRLPAHAAVGRAAPRPRVSADASKRLFRRLPGAARRPRATASLLAPRAATCSPSPAAAGCAPSPSARPASTSSAQVPDPELRAKLTPDYDIGCKRVLLRNDYYPALAQPNVSLVDDRRRRGPAARAWSTATASSTRSTPIVYGTGFRVMDIPVAHCLTGREGRTLAQEWERERRRGPPRHHGRRLPQPVPAARPQHRARPQLGRVHDRGADRVRRRGPARRCARTAPAALEVRRSRAGRLQRRAAGPARRHRLEHRRLPVLVPRRQRHRTSPSGRPTRSPSASRPRASTPRRTSCAPPPRAARSPTA